MKWIQQMPIWQIRVGRRLVPKGACLHQRVSAVLDTSRIKRRRKDMNKAALGERDEGSISQALLIVWRSQGARPGQTKHKEAVMPTCTSRSNPGKTSQGRFPKKRYLLPYWWEIKSASASSFTKFLVLQTQPPREALTKYWLQVVPAAGCCGWFSGCSCPWVLCGFWPHARSIGMGQPLAKYKHTEHCQKWVSHHCNESRSQCSCIKQESACVKYEAQ